MLLEGQIYPIASVPREALSYFRARWEEQRDAKARETRSLGCAQPVPPVSAATPVSSSPPPTPCKAKNFGEKRQVFPLRREALGRLQVLILFDLPHRKEIFTHTNTHPHTHPPGLF